MNDARLASYIEFFEGLSPDSLDKLRDATTENIHFRDPFNDVHGHAALRKIFEHMFAMAGDAEFTVTGAGLDQNDRDCGLLRWRMDYTVKDAPYVIVGMSEIVFAPDGRVCEHIDHWDSGTQFYGRLPVIGWLLGLIRARLSV